MLRDNTTSHKIAYVVQAKPVMLREGLKKNCKLSTFVGYKKILNVNNINFQENGLAKGGGVGQSE